MASRGEMQILFIILSLLSVPLSADVVDNQDVFTETISNELPSLATDEATETPEAPSLEPIPCPIPCEEQVPICCDPCEEDPRWYFELQPGYFFFTDHGLRDHFNGGFTGRGEVGYRFWKPLIVFVDGGYFQKEGQAVGGSLKTEIKVASLTLGLKAIYYFHDMIAGYVGAGPRLFMVAIHNHSAYIRGKDEAFGIGGGFDAGFWIFPFYRFCNFSKNVFLDLFADYSLKTMKIESDDAASDNSNVNIDSLTIGLGLGIRF